MNNLNTNISLGMRPFFAIALSLLLLSGQFASAQYCTTNLYTNGCVNDHISNFVTFGGSTNISNINSGCSGATAYNYYSTMTHTTIPGNSVGFTFTINPGSNYSQGVKIFVDWNNNNSFADPGDTMYTSSLPLAAGTTMYNNFIVPSNATAGTKRMRVRCVFNNTAFDACNSYQYGEVEDYNLNIVTPNTCSGTPTVSVSATAPNYCVASNVLLVATPGTVASGYTYQWQSRAACSNNAFTNISGATNNTYLISSLSASTDFRVQITCSNGNGTATSNPINVFPACYCTSTRTVTTGADIGYLYLTTTGVTGTYTNPTTTPTPLVNNTNATALYTNFSHINPIQLIPGVNSVFYITQINSTPTQTAAYLKVFVDFNRNGDFTDAGEQIFQGGGTSSTSATTITGTLPIPASATPGLTRMRMVLKEGGNSSNVLSCGTDNTGGETEDYTVLIRPAITPIAVSNSGPICVPSTSNLQLTCTPNNSNCVSYSWVGPNGFTSTLQNPTISNPTAAVAGIYTVTVSGYGISATASTTVSITTAPNISNVSVNSPTLCNGTNGSIILNGLNNNTTYSISYVFNGGTITSNFTSNNSGVIAINNLGGGVYSNITASLNGCVSSPIGPFTLINPTPTITSVTGTNPTSCGGNNGSISLTGLMPNTTYAVNFSWNSIAQPLQNLTANASGVITINNLIAGNYGGIFVSYATCPSNIVGPILITNPAPPSSPTISSNSPICSGSTLNLFSTSVTGATYTWAGPNSFSSNAQNPTITNASSLNSGTYSLYVTVNNCNSSTLTLSITVNPTPVITSSSSTNLTACGLNNGSISLNGLLLNTSYNLSYFNGISTINTTANSNSSGSIVINNLSAGTYSNISVSLNGCNSNTVGPITINNPASPNPPTVSNNGPVCEGSSLNLNASTISGATYSWSGPNAFSSSVQNQTINNVTSLTAGTYSVTVTVAGCVSTPATTLVVVKPLPTAPTTVNDTLCQFATTVPLTANGQNLTWYNSPFSTVGTNTAPTPSSNSAGTTTWYVSQTVNGCEGPKAPISITIKPQPAAPSATSPVIYCQGETAIPLTASGNNLKWYLVSVGGLGNSVAPTPSTTTAGSTNYYVSQTVNGCESNRTTITVNVFSQPDTPLVQNPIQLCVGDINPVLTVGGNNLKWYLSQTATNYTTTQPTINTSVAGTQILYVTQTAGNNCESEKAKVVVIINEQVQAKVQLSEQLICQYDTITVNNISSSPSNPPTSTYAWDFDGGTVISGSGEGPIKVKWMTPGHKTIKVKVTNYSCVKNDEDTLFAKTAPIGEFSIKPHACIDEVMYLQAAWNSTNNVSYFWTFSGASILNDAQGAGAYKIKFTSIGQKVISLYATLNGCRSKPFYDTIIIHNNPISKISAVIQDKICKGDSILFSFDGVENSNHNYFWDPAQFFKFNGQPSVLGTVKAKDWIKLSVVDEYGCVGKDSVFINAENCCDIALPDAFTPNNDGRNDVFRIISKGAHSISTFRIVNRWGQTVFETANSHIGWDGTSNGVPQDIGTYYYYLKFECKNDETIEKRGEVTLIR